MKKAILTVSYGTLRAEEMQNAVEPVCRAIEETFQDYACFRAYANALCISALRRSGATAYGCGEMLERLAAEGYDEIVVAALLISPGTVYDGILKAARRYPVSAPLLDGDGDFAVIGQIYGEIARSTGREVLLMGHGSDGEGDACYARLAEALPEHVHLACRMGRMRLEDVLARLNVERDRVLLMPLMLTAGRHAREEMAGDGSGSWKRILAEMGFDVQVRLEGMGSLTGVQDMFTDKVRAAIQRGMQE